MQETTTNTTRVARLTPTDRTLVDRTVGSLEYGSALRLFDNLLQQVNKEELAAIDAIVAERPEFGVYSGLSVRAGSPGNVLVLGGAPVNSAQQRRGFAWIIALARLELGGILATFTPARGPFDVVGTTPYDLEAYGELLLDGAQAHYQALASDPNVVRVARKIPDREVLSYIRRISVARQMLHAAMRANANRLTPPQLDTLYNQDRELSYWQEGYKSNVSAYLAANNYTKSTSSSTTMNREIWHGCGIMINGALNELRAGTATSQAIK